MTLPSASTLTDEQLRVLAAEAEGYQLLPISQNPSQKTWQRDGVTCLLPDPLHDANAAISLLEPFFAWKAGRLTGGGTYVEIIDTEERCIKMTPTDMINRWPFWAEAPDFCRAIVLSFLRAEGKIL